MAGDSNFAFLNAEWPALHEAAGNAESFAVSDPCTACVYARRGLEVFVRRLCKYDATLRVLYQDNLSALLHEPAFRNAAAAAPWRPDRRLIFPRSHVAAGSRLCRFPAAFIRVYPA
jgi:type I restriction enzyme R subunit